MLNKSFSLHVSKLIKSYNKTIRVDSDKSISIRSLRVTGKGNKDRLVILTQASIDCLKKLAYENGHSDIGSTQFFGEKGTNDETKIILNCGNSGTSMRLLSGLLSGQSR